MHCRLPPPADANSHGDNDVRGQAREPGIVGGCAFATEVLATYIDTPPRSRIVGAHNRLIFEGMQP